MNIIGKKYLFKAPVEKVWRSLVDPKIINKWGGGPAKMSDKKDVKFALWGGEIYGKNIEIVKNTKLVQNWYGGKWKEPSIVTFVLTKKGKDTVLDFVQRNVPDEEAKDVDEGWDDYYFGPMKEYLEKNS